MSASEILSQSHVNSLFKWLHDRSPTEGECVVNFMEHVFGLIDPKELDSEYQGKYQRLKEIHSTLVGGNYSILPVK